MNGPGPVPILRTCSVFGLVSVPDGDVYYPESALSSLPISVGSTPVRRG